ncbi:unnamed protein product [Phytophthora fragariaefolia]|uniref:Unnamed protein product n=1 Tax=Phytophthora fragariaefolia TaxID=1490495 RepID=A0A9W7D0Q0_9STRA|nr:unnamed protein product [Phytophthora fragariaefolia]
MRQEQEAVARMETRQYSALEKLNARLDLEVARRFGPRTQGASEKLEDVPSQTDNARVHRETETQEAGRLDAVRLGRERADALLAQCRAQTEAHQAESMQQELEDMRVERARERETAKNVQTILRGRLRNIRTTSSQTPPRPVTSQPDLATSRPILYPEPSGSDSYWNSGSSDQDSDHSDSSSFEDVAPNVPTVAGPGGTTFTFGPYVNASALEGFDEKASLAVRKEVVGKIPKHRSARRLDGQGQDLRDESEAIRRRPELALEVILERMEAKHKTSQVPFSGLSRTADGDRLQMESFDQHPDHPVSKTGIAPSAVNAAMISVILLRVAGLISSVAARGTQLDSAELDPVRFVRSFMKTNVDNGKIKLTSPLDGDPERVGPKTTPELCVLVYVGPELRNRSQDNHQCMTVISENKEYLSGLPLPDQLRLEENCPDNNDRDDPPEFRLGPGQRYGWWEEHNSDETKKVAMVHGAVNNCRTDILLDSGASVSMMSLDLARRLKLRLKFCKQLRVSKLGGVPTIITATTEVKITLGPRVVYIMELWVGDRWVTQIVYAARSWPVAVKVVNISDKTVWIDSRTVTQEYQWPKKLLVRSPIGSAQVHMVQLPPRPSVETVKSLAKTDAQLSETKCSGNSDSEGTESREAKLIEEIRDGHEDSGSPGEILEDSDPVIILDEDSDSDGEEFYDAISFDGEDGGEDFQEVVKAKSKAGACSGRLLLRVRPLEKEYKRCMQMSAVELNLEPAVYIHEGSELPAQLRDELAMLPELRELSPKCDIDKADVGEPGRTTPAQEEKLWTRLRYHHRIFLWDGNAAPAPARGVWCDLDVGDAKLVAQRPRCIAPHLAIKVYELLNKLLESGPI